MSNHPHPLSSLLSLPLAVVSTSDCGLIFVSVQQPNEEVRVAKEHGQLVAHVIDKGGKERVDVTIPWEVAQALISETTDSQLNISAAIKALENIGDMTLVTVASDDESVRIWVDSNNTDGK